MERGLGMVHHRAGLGVLSRSDGRDRACVVVRGKASGGYPGGHSRSMAPVPAGETKGGAGHGMNDSFRKKRLLFASEGHAQPWCAKGTLLNGSAGGLAAGPFLHRRGDG